MNTEVLIANLYSAFNRRDIDAALSSMADGISWPKASEGGRVTGKEEIRDYWTRQWHHFDPHVDPLSITTAQDDRIHVRVHQIVKNLAGETLSDSEVQHIYTLTGSLIARMDIGDDGSSQNAPSSAFAPK